MSLLRWFSGKPPQTDLEKFCGTLSLDKVGQIFETEPNSLGLAKSYALLLHMAHEFLEDTRKLKLIGVGPGLVKPNVVLFEVVTFLWSVVQVPIMRWAESEMDLDEDHEICNNISASLNLTFGLMENYWPNVSLDGDAKSRIYIGKIDESAAVLADWISSGAGLDVPATSRNKSLNIRTMPMNMACQLFALHMVPAVLETLKRQIAVLVRDK